MRLLSWWHCLKFYPPPLPNIASYLAVSRIKQYKDIKRQQLWDLLNFSRVAQFTISLSISRQLYPDNNIQNPPPHFKIPISTYYVSFCLEHNKHSFAFFLLQSFHIKDLGCCLCVIQFKLFHIQSLSESYIII